jgi:aryl sulfotransferase
MSQIWPEKEGEFVTGSTDSTRWNGFAFRDDDIVVATYPKSGTTLTQQIVGQLLLGPDPDLFGGAPELTPWIDFLATPAAREIAEGQTRRRYLKTHLARQHLPISPLARYLVVLRDPRDVAWSLHNHLSAFDPEFEAAIGVPPVTEDVRAYYHEFLDGPAQQPPFWPWVQGWWDVRNLPNVLLLHYADIIGDMAGQVRRIAGFIDAPLDDDRLSAILPFCTLEHMRKVAADDPFLKRAFTEGATKFFNKGVNARWRDTLSPDEIAKADVLAQANLTPDCAAWVMRS